MHFVIFQKIQLLVQSHYYKYMELVTSINHISNIVYRLLIMGLLKMSHQLPNLNLTGDKDCFQGSNLHTLCWIL